MVKISSRVTGTIIFSLSPITGPVISAICAKILSENEKNDIHGKRNLTNSFLTHGGSSVSGAVTPGSKFGFKWQGVSAEVVKGW